ncbi:MAG: copper homeostasis protein CutC [Erysipelotrichaceae bacterium]
MNNIVEICCGSYEDVIIAYKAKANRIELNSALALGGLTPSFATLIESKKSVDIPIICMVRNRGAGFNYSQSEKAIMMKDATCLLEQGADGIAFGFLNEDKTIDKEATKAMCNLIHHYHGQAVFHRAFDCAFDLKQACQDLIDCQVDRVLTSGGKVNASQGIEMINELQITFGNQIEFVAGCGVNEMNALTIIKKTGIHQVHSSCKGWLKDITTKGKEVSYAFDKLHPEHFDGVDYDKVVSLTKAVFKG